MRGKKAKRLRRIAFLYVRDVMKEDPSKDENVYNQARNMAGWEHMRDDNGMPILDPEGHPLKRVITTLPGTITCANKVRNLYRTLKKRSKINHGP